MEGIAQHRSTKRALHATVNTTALLKFPHRLTNTQIGVKLPTFYSPVVLYAAATAAVVSVFRDVFRAICILTAPHHYKESTKWLKVPG
jgi:hypothetical protein